MEIALTSQADTQVAVSCNGQPSHIFDLRQLIADETRINNPPQPLDDPIAYGRAIYQALFPPATPTGQALDAGTDRILLVTTDDTLQAVPWEYAYSPDGFIILDYPFVRGLIPEQRIDPPTLNGGLHIVAVPSNPLDKNVVPLNIDGEWLRLKEIIQELPQAITLERTRPPTLEQLRRLVANQRLRVVHFMGHGGQGDAGSLLFFENIYGALQPVTARDFTRRVRGTVFLVTLNACVSATPGPTEFSNLAAALVQRKTPYVLGMRFSIVDEDARVLSGVLYSELARGSSVEEAVYQARLELAESPRSWVVGVPVLYTALKSPVSGFTQMEGSPTILEHQPKFELEAGVLPRAEGMFQGRSEELKAIGQHLTGDSRPRLLTIHGGGGQGKTALAREAVERFAHAWPGGVWASSLEDLPDRWRFVTDLAHFLGLDTAIIRENIVKAKTNTAISEIEAEVQQQVEQMTLGRLSKQRTLVVLDNAETLIEKVEDKDEAALELAEFIRQYLPGPTVTLLTTSRYHLGWGGEILLELGGLSPSEGARLFRQSVPLRRIAAGGPLTEELSQKVEGQPLSLRLLGGAFDTSDLTLEAFVEQYKDILLEAEDKYAKLDHRHRTLFASIDTSVKHINENELNLLSKLIIFDSPFLMEAVVDIFDSDIEEFDDAGQSLIRLQLGILQKRGLLVRQNQYLDNQVFEFFRLLPPIRLYVENYLMQQYPSQELLQQFGVTYSALTKLIHDELIKGESASFVAKLIRKDLLKGATYVRNETQGFYYLHLGWISIKSGDMMEGISLLEKSLAIAQGNYRELEIEVFQALASAYQIFGHLEQALVFWELALAKLDPENIPHHKGMEGSIVVNISSLYIEIGQYEKAQVILENAMDNLSISNKSLHGISLIPQKSEEQHFEASVFHNLAKLYQSKGNMERSIEFFKQALENTRRLGNLSEEGTILNNMAQSYKQLEQLDLALEFYNQALLIARKVNDRVLESACLNNIGELFRGVGDLDNALLVFNQVLDIHREKRDNRTIATTLNNIALVYAVTGQTEQALTLYTEALYIKRTLKDKLGEANTLCNMAISLYRNLGQQEEAITYLEQAVNVMVEAGFAQLENGITVNHLREVIEIMRKGDPFEGIDFPVEEMEN